jgi:DNA-binding Xre family transcriptional regulator
MIMNPIARNIDARMKANAISITGLEAKAGLKPHSVRNIVTGKSKNPSAINLQAIADVLGCTVKDLLSPLDFEKETLSSEETLQKNYQNSSLMTECIRTIDKLLQKTSRPITQEQYLTCVREVYLHSLQNRPAAVNKDFAEWFVNLMRQELP